MIVEFGTMSAHVRRRAARIDLFHLFGVDGGVHIAEVRKPIDLQFESFT
jgi:hypothetical protein